MLIVRQKPEGMTQKVLGRPTQSERVHPVIEMSSLHHEGLANHG